MSLTIKNFYEFGPFCLDPEERVLLRDGKHIPLTPKVFDTLFLLVQNSGHIVSKEDMLNTIWQDSFVEESNLAVNIRKLRQILGDEKDSPIYIETIPKRGYRFKAEVKEVLQESLLAPAPEIRLRNTTHKSETDINSEVFLNSLNDMREEDARLLSSQTIQEQITQQPAGSSFLFPSKINKLLLVTVCLCLLVIVAGFIYWRNIKTVAEDKNRADLKFERLSIGNTAHVTLSPDEKYLAYTSRTGGRESLWLRQIETNTNKEIIPPDDSSYFGIAFSNDSQQIYFARVKDNKPGSIYRISILGGAETELIKDPQGQFSISPDNKQIAFVRYYQVENNTEHALFVSDIDGKNERKLITRLRPDRLWSPTWLPDGQNLVCIAGNSDTAEPAEQIIEVRVSDGVENLLLKPSWFHIVQIKSLEDGSGLLLTATENQLGSSQLYFFDYKSKEISQITNDSTDYKAFSMTGDARKIALTQVTFTSNVWIISKDGEVNAKQISIGTDRVNWTVENKIIFTVQMNKNVSIWSINSDGSDKKQLSFNSDNCLSPVISPDSRHIVFYSNRMGKNHIWRMDSDGNNQIQLTNGFGEQAPSISPDGKWVFYNSVDRFNVWKVSIDGDNAVKVTDEICIKPEVSNDGKMFACYGRTPLNKLQLAIYGVEDGKLIKTFDLASEKISFTNLHWTFDSKAIDYGARTIGVEDIWRQPLDGSKPRQMTHFKSELIFGFDWSPDGKQLALTRGYWEDNIVLMTGFR